MKKTVFRGGALLLAFVLPLLSACGAPRHTLVGTWLCAVEEKDRFNAAFAAAGLGDEICVNHFALPVALTFFPDGTYEKTVSEDEVKELLSQLQAELRSQWDAMIDARAAAAAVSRETFISLMESDPEVLFDSLVNEEAVLAAAEEMRGAGRYLLQGDRLYLSADRDKAVDESVYERCELSENTLTLTQPFGPGREEEASRYPLTFTRVG